MEINDFAWDRVSSLMETEFFTLENFQNWRLKSGEKELYILPIGCSTSHELPEFSFIYVRTEEQAKLFCRALREEFEQKLPGTEKLEDKFAIVNELADELHPIKVRIKVEFLELININEEKEE